MRHAGRVRHGYIEKGNKGARWSASFRGRCSTGDVHVGRGAPGGGSRSTIYGGAGYFAAAGQSGSSRKRRSVSRDVGCHAGHRRVRTEDLDRLSRETDSPGKPTFAILLFSAENGALRAVMAAGHLTGILDGRGNGGRGEVSGARKFQSAGDFRSGRAGQAAGGCADGGAADYADQDFRSGSGQGGRSGEVCARDVRRGGESGGLRERSGSGERSGGDGYDGARGSVFGRVD